MNDTSKIYDRLARIETRQEYAIERLEGVCLLKEEMAVIKSQLGDYKKITFVSIAALITTSIKTWLFT